MATSIGKSPIRRGTESLLKKESVFLQVKSGEPIDIVPLTGGDGMISVDQHAIWPENDNGRQSIFVCIHGSKEKCPGCQIDDKAKFRGFLPVWNKDQGVKIFAFGIQIARALAAAEQAIDGGILNQVIRISKNGTGLMTNYTVTPTGRKVTTEVAGLEVPSIEENLGPLSREGILQLMVASGNSDLIERLEKVLTPAEKLEFEMEDEIAVEPPTPAPAPKAPSAPKTPKAEKPAETPAPFDPDPDPTPELTEWHDV